ncbi:D-alanyl-lipoteichoic acid biosynthesis protein DltD [Lapidilactobacillus mulanensis]|uniref:Protein DltD n=1 Tax=Lapidilactobacillus mulanensis TaxID=2485999 RepID=A0ABW4DMN7_9LACO|nr:D-alanyl-lipoteichoic acid biosynthesis protein DltD [Lapidilactobacillus mulanensis]
MKTRKKLWLIFGPVIIAAIAVWLVLLLPFSHQRISQDSLKHGAVSLSTNVYHGQLFKKQAFSENYVPFLGSSELLRMDPLHPSVLAAKYHRSYQPFLLGNAGSQSLNHFFTLQGVHPQLQGKKIVYIISPQWFTKRGQEPDAFSFYYSPLQAIQWLLSVNDSTATRYAAKRLLEMPSGKASSTIAAALNKVAKGERLNQSDRFLLNLRLRILLNEDALFSRFSLADHWKTIEKGERLLPSHDSDTLLTKTAIQLAKKHTNNNTFGIDNHFYSERLRGSRINGLRNSQKHYDYRQSPEYSDLELLLTEFKQLNANVLFVIPPINQKWATYTGLPLPMLQETATKIKYQLRSQGFNHIADLTNDTHANYMMQDTIHLGWLGWLKVDEKVNPFLTQTQAQPRYQLNSYFFTPQWQKSLTLQKSDGTNGK